MSHITTPSNRLLAVFAYLLPVVGPLVILLFSRRQLLAAYHACQSMGLTATLIAAPLVWYVGGWLLLWIPYAGALAAVFAFAIVILAFLFGIVALLAGILHAARAQPNPVPFFGQWGDLLAHRIGLL